MTPDLPPVPPGFSEPIMKKVESFHYTRDCDDVVALFNGEWAKLLHPGVGSGWVSFRLGSPIARANGIGGDHKREIGDDGLWTSDPHCLHEWHMKANAPTCHLDVCVKCGGERRTDKPESPKSSGNSGEVETIKTEAPEYHGGFMSPERAQKLESDLAAARAENDKLRTDFANLEAGRATLFDLAVRNGTITAEVGSEACQVMAAQFSELLREKGGENYMEMHLTDTRYEGEKLVVTLRWHKGKTPDEMRRLAEGREQRLRAALEFYADVSKYPSPKTGGLGELYFDCGETARKALAPASSGKGEG
jgi:hypothetical protein